jgi:hypothetical protein
MGLSQGQGALQPNFVQPSPSVPPANVQPSALSASQVPPLDKYWPLNVAGHVPGEVGDMGEGGNVTVEWDASRVPRSNDGRDGGRNRVREWLAPVQGTLSLDKDRVRQGRNESRPLHIASPGREAGDAEGGSRSSGNALGVTRRDNG